MVFSTADPGPVFEEWASPWLQDRAKEGPSSRKSILSSLSRKLGSKAPKVLVLWLLPTSDHADVQSLSHLVSTNLLPRRAQALPESWRIGLVPTLSTGCQLQALHFPSPWQVRISKADQSICGIHEVAAPLLHQELSSVPYV